MTVLALASMTICAPVATASGGRTRLVRRGAVSSARARAIGSKSVQERSRRFALSVGPVGRGATRELVTRRRRGSAVVAAGGVGVFGDDAEVDKDVDVDLDMDEDLDALFETDSLDESVDEDDASPDDSIDASADASSPDASHEDLTAHASEEPETNRVVLGGPVTDAFSALVLAMRAKGHGETTTADAGAGGPGEITSYSSFANPTPWSTFDKMHAGEVKNCLGDVRRTLKAYAAHAAPAGALNERLMGAVGAAWLETRDAASLDDSLPGATGKERAFVWGGGEKFATLLNDTCVHRVLFRDEPTAAGNRLVADTLMTLQDLATARVPLSADAVNVALAACAAVAEHVAGSDRAGAACDRLAANALPPSDAAMQVVRRGGLRLVGRTGYPKEKDAERNATYDRGGSRFDRGSSFEPGAGQDRKAGDWDCPDCGFMNFASRSQCFKCGAGGGGGGDAGTRDRGGFDLRDARPRYDDRGRENRDGADLRPGDWRCPSCNFANFASRTECKRCGEAGGNGGYGGGGWDRDNQSSSRARVWSDDSGERWGYDRGFDRAAGRDRRYGSGAESGGFGGRGRGGGRSGGRGGSGRVNGRGRRDDGDFGGGGGWDDRADDGFGAY